MFKTILCIDNDPSVAAGYESVLEEGGYSVLIAFDGHFGLDVLARQKIDAALVDYEMPEMDGADVVREIWKRKPHIPIILTAESETIPRDIRSKLWTVLGKPADTRSLLVEFGTALEDKTECKQVVQRYPHPSLLNWMLPPE